MVIKSTKKVNCEGCGEEITLREYEGLEGGWYTDHFCEWAHRRKCLTSPRPCGSMVVRGEGGPNESSSHGRS